MFPVHFNTFDVIKFPFKDNGEKKYKFIYFSRIKLYRSGEIIPTKVDLNLGQLARIYRNQNVQISIQISIIFIVLYLIFVRRRGGTQ